MICSFDQIILVRYDLEPARTKKKFGIQIPNIKFNRNQIKGVGNKTCGQSHRHTMLSLYARQQKYRTPGPRPTKILYSGDWNLWVQNGTCFMSPFWSTEFWSGLYPHLLKSLWKKNELESINYIVNKKYEISSKCELHRHRARTLIKVNHIDITLHMLQKPTSSPKMTNS